MRLGHAGPLGKQTIRGKSASAITAVHVICVQHPWIKAQQASSEAGVGQQGELPRRAVTAADFFHRYPSLHAFLLERLRQAILHLTAARASACPSLFPILALLSRLRSGGSTCGFAPTCPQMACLRAVSTASAHAAPGGMRIMSQDTSFGCLLAGSCAQLLYGLLQMFMLLLLDAT